MVTVSADVKPRSQSDRVLQSLTAETLPALQQKYPGLTYSFEGRQADRRESMHGLLMGLLMALVVIYGLLAIPFNSFVQPMIIMITIPFGIIGAVIGLLSLLGPELGVTHHSGSCERLLAASTVGGMPISLQAKTKDCGYIVAIFSKPNLER